MAIVIKAQYPGYHRPAGPSERNQVADEDEGLARPDQVPGAPVPVGHPRRDDQLTAATDLHAGHALVPAGDDLPGTQPEFQRAALVPAGVEFFPGGVGHPDVVDLDRIPRLGHLTVTFPDVGDLQLGRRFTAGKVDLWLADAHSRLSQQRPAAGGYLVAVLARRYITAGP